MEIVKLLGTTKPYIWGGNRLRDYGKVSNDNFIAESWELSFHPDGLSIINSGKDKGKFLSQVASQKDIGTNCLRFPFFPILIKLIDAQNDLSIQVHPSDQYALEKEHSFGKTEMWYVVDATKDAMLHIGFNKNVSKEEVEEHIKNNTLMKIMNHIKVQPGDCYYIPSGTIHAIGSGCLIAEIQENSNLTYRVYDYGRVGSDGKARELHIKKALEVINFNKSTPTNLQSDPLVECSYFAVSKVINPTEIITDEKSFVTFTVLKGEAKINEKFLVKKGDTVFIPTNKKASIKGDIEIIKTFID